MDDCHGEGKQASTDNLPVSDFDLLKQFYPTLDMRDLDTAFVAAEVGDNFLTRT